MPLGASNYQLPPLDELLRRTDAMEAASSGYQPPSLMDLLSSPMARESQSRSSFEEQDREQARRIDTITDWANWYRKNPDRLSSPSESLSSIPFVSTAMAGPQMAEAMDVRGAFERVFQGAQRDNPPEGYTPQQWEDRDYQLLARELVKDEVRGTEPWALRWGAAAANSAAFAAEFGLTSVAAPFTIGPRAGEAFGRLLGRGATAVGKKVATKIGGRAGQAVAGAATAAAKGAEFTGRALGRAATSPGMLAQNVGESMKPQYGENLTGDPEKDAQILADADLRPFAEAVTRGYTMTAIETFSEQTGPAIGKAFRVLGAIGGKGIARIAPETARKLGVGQQRIIDAWIGNAPGRTTQMADEYLKAVGWNGFIQEVGEERVAEILHGTFGTAPDFGMTGKLLSGDIQGTLADAAQEAYVLGMSGGAQRVAGQGMQMAGETIASEADASVARARAERRQPSQIALALSPQHQQRVEDVQIRAEAGPIVRRAVDDFLTPENVSIWAKANPERAQELVKIDTPSRSQWREHGPGADIPARSGEQRQRFVELLRSEESNWKPTPKPSWMMDPVEYLSGVGVTSTSDERYQSEYQNWRQGVIDAIERGEPVPEGVYDQDSATAAAMTERERLVAEQQEAEKQLQQGATDDRANRQQPPTVPPQRPEPGQPDARRTDRASPVRTDAQPEGRIVTARWEYTADEEDVGSLGDIAGHLAPHQQQGVAKAVKSMDRIGGFLLADGTGAGKTRQILAVAKTYSDRGNPVIIIAPNEVLGKPYANKNKISGSYANDSQAMGVPISLTKGETTLKPGTVYVTTYHKLDAIKGAVTPETIIIYDEAHALKNEASGTARAETAGDIARKSKAVLFATATPADKPLHIFYLHRMGAWEGKPWHQVAGDLGLRKTTINGKEFWAVDPKVGAIEVARRISDLFDRLTAKGQMIKREISFKGVKVQFRRVAIPEEAKKAIDDIARGFLGTTDVSAAKGLLKARVLMHQRRQQEPYKVPIAVDMVKEELAAGRQVVLFVSRVNFSEAGRDIYAQNPFTGEMEKVGREVYAESEGTAKLVREALKKEGIVDFVELHGGTKTKAANAMKQFQDGSARVMIATIESGGTGINLDDVVGNRPRTLIVVTAPFSSVDNVQAAGRVWRMTTKSFPKIRYLFGDTQVDDWNASIIASKMKTLGATVQGEVRVLSADIDQIDQIGETDPLEELETEEAPPADKSESIAGVTPPATPSPVKKKRRAEFSPKQQLDFEVEEFSGGDPEIAKVFREVIDDVWEEQNGLISDENTKLRSAIGKTSGAKQGAFIRKVQKANDPSEVPGFDEVLDAVLRHHPELLQGQGATGESVGRGDAEHALFMRLKEGMKKPLAKHSPEVIAAAKAQIMAQHHELFEEQKKETPDEAYDRWERDRDGEFPEEEHPDALTPMDDVPFAKMPEPKSSRTTKVYHEGGVGPDIEAMIPGSQTSLGATWGDQIFVSDDATLAIGQRGKGVLIEFDLPNELLKEHKKPGAGIVGGREYKVQQQRSTLKPHVVAVTVKKGAKADRPNLVRLKRVLAALESKGWAKTETPEGTTWRKPEKKVPKAESPQHATAAPASPSRRQPSPRRRAEWRDLPPESAAGKKFSTRQDKDIQKWRDSEAARKKGKKRRGKHRRGYRPTVGLASINDFLFQQLKIMVLPGKTRLRSKYAARYEGRTYDPGTHLSKILHIVRTRSRAMQANFHESGHGIWALMSALDADWKPRLAPVLKHLATMEGSIASAPTEQEGFAEFVRLYITDIELLDPATIERVEKEIERVLPDALAAMRDAHRAYTKWRSTDTIYQRLSMTGDRIKGPLQGTTLLEDVHLWMARFFVGPKYLIDRITNRFQIEQLAGTGATGLAARILDFTGLFSSAAARTRFARNLREYRNAAARFMSDIADTPADFEAWVKFTTKHTFPEILRATGRGGSVRVRSFGGTHLRKGEKFNPISPELREAFAALGMDLTGIEESVAHGEWINMPGKSWYDIRESAGNNYHIFSQYWRDRSALERLQKSKENPDSPLYRYPGDDIHDPATLREELDRVEEEFPEVVEWAADARRYFDNLLLVAHLSGEFSAAEVLRMLDTHRHYAPLEHFNEETGVDSPPGGGGAMPASSIRRDRGGSVVPFRDLDALAHSRTKAVYSSYYGSLQTLSMAAFSARAGNDRRLREDVRLHTARLMLPLDLEYEHLVTLSVEEQRKAIANAINRGTAAELGVEVADIPDDMFVEPDNIEEVFNGRLELEPIKKFGRTPPKAARVVSAFDNGTRRYWQVTDPYMYRLLTHTPEGPGKGWRRWQRLAGGLARPIRRTITESFAFVVRNVLFRDPQTAIEFSNDPKLLIPFYALTMGVISRVTGEGQEAISEMFGRTIEETMGDQHPQRLAFWVERFKEGIILPREERERMTAIDWAMAAPGIVASIVNKPAEMLATLSTLGLSAKTETLAREGAALAARRAGYGPLRAQMAYDEITGDFGNVAMSPGAAALIRSVPFLNPMIQILYQQSRYFTHPDPQTRAYYFGVKLPVLASIGSALAVVGHMALMSDDDEDYRNLILNQLRERTATDRARYATITIGGQTLRIPFERGMVGAVVSTAFNVTQAKLLGEEDPVRAKEVASQMLDRIFSAPHIASWLGDAMPPFIRTQVELSLNHSFFMEREITPPYLKEKYRSDPSLQVLPDTPAIYRKLQSLPPFKWFQMNPVEVQYLVRGTFSNVTDEWLQAFSMMASEEDRKNWNEMADTPYIGSLFAREPKGWFSASVQSLQDYDAQFRVIKRQIEVMEQQNQSVPPALMEKYRVLETAHKGMLRVEKISRQVNDLRKQPNAQRADLQRLQREMTRVAADVLKVARPAMEQADVKE